MQYFNGNSLKKSFKKNPDLIFIAIKLNELKIFKVVCRGKPHPRKEADMPKFIFYLLSMFFLSTSNLVNAQSQGSANGTVTIAADENIEVKVKTPVGADFEYKKGEPEKSTTTIERTTVVEKEPAKGGCNCDLSGEVPLSPNYFLASFILLLAAMRSWLVKSKSRK